MSRAILVIFTAAVICIFCLGGCKKSPSGTDSGQQEVVNTATEYQTDSDVEEEVKPATEYMEEAEREITLQNMEAELRKIEKELKQEISEE